MPSEQPDHVPELPGIVVRRALGRGRGAPWLGRSADGTWVVVRAAEPPPNLPTDAGLLPVLETLRDRTGQSWVLTPYRSGSGLDRRLAVVRAGDQRLAMVCGAAVARALAALHAAGLAHTDLTADRVLLGPGEGVLLDATCASPWTPTGGDADLQALADLLVALCPRLSGPLSEAVAVARRGGTATQVAELLPAGSHGNLDAARPARVPRAARAGLGAAAVAALFLLAMWAGVRLAEQPPSVARLAGRSPSSSSSSSVPAPSADLSASTSPPARPVTRPDPAEEWTAVLRELDLARAAALAAADPTLLAAVDAPGSKALRRDLAIVESLRRGNAVAEGLVMHLLGVSALHVGRAAAVLQVTDRRSAYLLRGAGGEVLAKRAARGPASWRVRLVMTAEGWRVASVQRIRPADHRS